MFMAPRFHGDDAWIPAYETVSQLFFCHSVQAKRDTESSIISKFWIPACAGMTSWMMISEITTQSLLRNDRRGSFSKI